MEGLKFEEMTNSELNLEKVKMENEYEALKAQVMKCTQRMQELDHLFVEATNEQNKRRVLI